MTKPSIFLLHFEIVEFLVQRIQAQKYPLRRNDQQIKSFFYSKYFIIIACLVSYNTFKIPIFVELLVSLNMEMSMSFSS